MLFNEKINSISLIDYEKIEYNNFIWDIADLSRSLLKLDKFDNNLFKICIEKYCEIKNIPDIEKNEIINYLKTLIFHVILQYFLALFPESGVENKI
jgi:Ser/Thr protein kinase RdoA (MazF antagonist)